MEKYSHIKEFTEQFLHGHLETLRMDYESDHSAIVDIIYEDDSHYSFEYKLSIDNDTHKIKFLEHFCNYSRDHIELKRNQPFEAAISQYLLGS